MKFEIDIPDRKFNKIKEFLINDEGVDELSFLDITASYEKRKINLMYEEKIPKVSVCVVIFSELWNNRKSAYKLRW